MCLKEKRKKLRFWVCLFLSSREFHGVIREWKLYHDCVRTYLRMWGHIWGAREVGQLTRISVQLRVWDKIILLFVYWTRGVLSFKHTCCQLQWSNFSDLFICIWKILLDLKKKWCKFDPWNDKVSVNDCLKMIFNVQILLIFLLWCYPQDQ